jgi:hypothetical protein
MCTLGKDFYSGLTSFLVTGGHTMTIHRKGQAFEIWGSGNRKVAQNAKDC